MQYSLKDIKVNFGNYLFFSISIFLINVGIFAHPIDFFYETKVNFGFISNIAIYIICLLNFFYLIKFIKNKIRFDHIIKVFFLIYFLQGVGSLNLWVFNDVLFREIGKYAIFYFISSLTVMLIVLNIINNKNKNLIELSGFFQLLILFTILTIVILKANPFLNGYGVYLIDFTSFIKKTFLINSNGLGRLSAVICIVFYNYFIFSKNKNFKIIYFLTSLFFLSLTLVTEGRLNFIFVHISLIILTFLSNLSLKGKISFFLLMVVLAQCIYKIDIKIRKNRIMDAKNIIHLESQIKEVENLLKKIEKENIIVKEEENIIFTDDGLKATEDKITHAKKEEIIKNLDIMSGDQKSMLNEDQLKKLDELLKNKILENKTKGDHDLQYLDYNSGRVLGNLTTTNPFRNVETAPIFLRFYNEDIEKKYPFIKKINDYTNGRVYKWIVIAYRNQYVFLGAGPQIDRKILYDYSLIGNNDSASALFYTYAVSGLLGVTALIYFHLLILYNYIIKKNAIKTIRENPTQTLSLTLIIMVLLRAVFENSYAIYGFDFLILIFSLINLNNNKN